MGLTYEEELEIELERVEHDVSRLKVENVKLRAWLDRCLVMIEHGENACPREWCAVYDAAYEYREWRDRE